MGYTIEISFNIAQASQKSKWTQIVNTLSEKYNFEFYETYEFEANIKCCKSHYIVTIHFHYNDNLVIKFIKDTKKISGLNIESIYNEFSNKLIYASKFYKLQVGNKETLKYFKPRAYSLNDADIIKELK